MDVVATASNYFTKMVSTGDYAAVGTSAAKMKILLLDSETVGNSSFPPLSLPPLFGPVAVQLALLVVVGLARSVGTSCANPLSLGPNSVIGHNAVYAPAP